MTDLLIVGGGPAGLAAAMIAGRRGLTVRLVESADEVGGMAASFTVGGVRVDHGSHRLHPAAAPRVLRLLDELLGAELQVRERNGRLRLADRWVGFPFRPVDLARSLPPSFAARAIADAAGRPFRRRRADSYAEVVRVGLGRTALEGFHGPMATKLWGLEPTELAAELATRRIPVRGPAALATKIIGGARSSGRVFLYPRTGFGLIVERLADAAIAAGAEIHTSTRVTGLEPGDDGPEVTVDRGRPERVGRVLWTAPIGALRQLVDPGTDVRSLTRRGLVLAYLGVPANRWSPFDAHYVPDPEVAFSRLSEPRNYRDGPDPADRTVLCAELPCTPGDTVWRSEPSTIASLVVDGLRRCDLPVPEVDQVEVRRLPSVYPVLTVGDAGRRRRELAWADALPGITVLGRQGRGTADNLHHVLDMAIEAVDRIGTDEAWDGASWAEATDRFERFVVED